MASQDRPGQASDASSQATSGARPKSGAPNRANKPAAKTPAAAASAAPTAPLKRADRRAEMIQKRREERLTQYERRKKEWLYTRIGLGALAVLILAGLGWGAWTAYDNWREEQDLEGVVDFEYSGGQHVAEGETVTYTESPPVGGAHDNAWQNCGFYDGQIRNENAVHSLEHGAVWITFRPDLPQEDIDKLQDKAEDEAYVLVSAYPGLQAPVVVQSWNHQLVLDSADDDRLDTFIRVYLQGSDTPEPGASCTGQVSTSTPV
jgi:hypothetical protein